MKITVVGAGSTYTPELMEGFLNEAAVLGLQEVCLFDIDPERLRIVGALAVRMAQAAGAQFTVTQTMERRQAIAGSSFVLNQIRVGGQAARHQDTLTCLAEDVIGQETTGAAGFAKAMRTIPVVLDICRDIEELAPDAWLINFTNPAGIITEAILKHSSVKAVGLCNVPIGMQMNMAKEYGVDYKDIDLDYVGLNHLSWVRKVWVEGQDKTEEVRSQTAARMANVPALSVSASYLKALGMIPSSYLNYFYITSEMLKHLHGQDETRAQTVMAVERTLLEKYKSLDLTVKPKELEQRGGAHYSTAALNVVRDIHINAGTKQIVNVRNHGAIPGLPSDCVVEVTAVVDARGAIPLAVNELHPSIRGLVQQVKAYEELTVEAAVSKDFETALLALAANPLVDSVQKAERLLTKFNDDHHLDLH